LALVGRTLFQGDDRLGQLFVEMAREIATRQQAEHFTERAQHAAHGLVLSVLEGVFLPVARRIPSRIFTTRCSGTPIAFAISAVSACPAQAKTSRTCWSSSASVTGSPRSCPMRAA